MISHTIKCARTYADACSHVMYCFNFENASMYKEHHRMQQFKSEHTFTIFEHTWLMAFKTHILYPQSDVKSYYTTTMDLDYDPFECVDPYNINDVFVWKIISILEWYRSETYDNVNHAYEAYCVHDDDTYESCIKLLMDIVGNSIVVTYLTKEENQLIIDKYGPHLSDKMEADLLLLYKAAEIDIDKNGCDYKKDTKTAFKTAFCHYLTSQQQS